MMFSPKRLLLLSLLAIGLASGVAPGQAATGHITGTIEDAPGAGGRAAGAARRGPAAVVHNPAGGARGGPATGDGGDFAFLSLPPGKYKVEVAAKGFKRTVVEELGVNVTQTSIVKPKLEPSTLHDTVTVTAEGTLVQQESSQVGRVIESRSISQLPLPTRNFQQLLPLSPGTSASVSNNTELGRGDAIISVNGQRTTSNSVRINGIDATSVGTNSTPNIAVPATDSLQEFVVQTSLYDASQGRNAGGNVEAVTKSGGREFHGNIYEFLRNDALNANDFCLNSAGRPRPVLTRNQYGGTLGGPLVKDKLFFFTSYQGTRERNGASLNNSLRFPVIPVALTDNNRTAAGLAAAFGLPVANITPITVSILSARPPGGAFAIPSATTASGLSPQSGISTFRENQFNGNVDWTINDKHTFSAKNFLLRNTPFQSH